MTHIRAWLDGRRPEAPAELRTAIEDAVQGASSGSMQDVLERGTQRCLASALARPGRIRESAFDLLSADGLLTYACEAALESEEPGAALTAILDGLLDRPAVP